MKVKDLREWINALPAEFDENDVVYRKLIGELTDGDTWGCLDVPISGVGIDSDDNEMYLCDEETSDKIEKEWS